ncbi:hypothetical protein [Pseudofrankia inefficax]|uniref:Uncharacterized protein n=1 Tax=Pseudofrankia inefficax (strain DSM 45817 / CECT 9037 / DDB 130130 / EuI1c) TaxID=298654 RepID=E3JBV6_PSEI1|nr:hypothetical protein [Pseudofrankia inefficax]ADP82266.1 hypothetical protein FraEuI1c_4267 [Pseudofrankia inefficax]
MTEPVRSLAADGAGSWVEGSLERLRSTALRAMRTHADLDGVCTGCGGRWPCSIVALADSNLALLDQPDLSRGAAVAAPDRAGLAAPLPARLPRPRAALDEAISERALPPDGGPVWAADR